MIGIHSLLALGPDSTNCDSRLALASGSGLQLPEQNSEEDGSNSLHWLTRLQPIRTISRLDLDFAVFTPDSDANREGPV